MDDAELYLLMQQDAEARMRACIRQYHALVHSICRAILRRTPEDEEECVNDTFLQLWRTLGSIREPAHLRAYLCCIARNQALSRYRALTAGLPRADTLPEDLTDETDVILAFEKRADAEALQKAIMALKEPDREIFVRKYYRMESMRALAERFHLTEKAVDNILYRSKQRLRKMLEEDAI